MTLYHKSYAGRSGDSYAATIAAILRIFVVGGLIGRLFLAPKNCYKNLTTGVRGLPKVHLPFPARSGSYGNGRSVPVATLMPWLDDAATDALAFPALAALRQLKR